jgi:DNA gyrase subunit A
MGRTAAGVRAINLEKGDRVIGAVVLRRSGTTILVATESGYGKRSETDEYRVSHRSGKGIITVKTTDKTGKMVAIKEVVEKEDVVIVTSGGIVIRQHASEIRVAGRNTQGVRLIRLDEGDTISDVAVVMPEDEEPTGGNGDKGGPPSNDVKSEAPKSEQANLFAPEKKSAERDAEKQPAKKSEPKGKTKKRK